VGNSRETVFGVDEDQRGRRTDQLISEPLFYCPPFGPSPCRNPHKAQWQPMISRAAGGAITWRSPSSVLRIGRRHLHAIPLKILLNGHKHMFAAISMCCPGCAQPQQHLVARRTCGKQTASLRINLAGTKTWTITSSSHCVGPGQPPLSVKQKGRTGADNFCLSSRLESVWSSIVIIPRRGRSK
jgi:hypothetical protein